MKPILSLCCILSVLLFVGYGVIDGVGVGWIFFALSPYLLMLWMLKIAQSQSARQIAYSGTIFMLILGLYLLLDKVHVEEIIHNKLSFIVVPVGQWVLLLLLVAVVWLSNEPVQESRV